MRRLNLGFHLSHITTTSCTGPDRIGTVQIVKVTGPGRSIFWLDRSISSELSSSNCQKGLSTIRLRYPVLGTVLAGTGAEPDSKKWPDIRSTGTGYPVHP